MRLPRLGWLVLVACLVGSSTQAGNQIKDRDWPNNTPLLALNPDGTGLLILADPRVGRNVEATALLRIAEEQSPGMVSAFGTLLFQRWLAEGRITRRNDGTLDWGTQENFDDLNTLLRAAVVTQLRPRLNAIRTHVSESEIHQMAWAGTSTAVQLAPTGPGSTSVVQPMTCVTTQCGACEGGDDGSPYCPGETSCVSGCGSTCTNCEEIIVQPPPEPPPPLECPEGMTPEECWPVEITRKRTQ